MERVLQEGEDPFDFAVDFAAEHGMVRRKDWGEEDNQKLLAGMRMRWAGERMEEPNVVAEHRTKWRSGDGGQGA